MVRDSNKLNINYMVKYMYVFISFVNIYRVVAICCLICLIPLTGHHIKYKENIYPKPRDADTEIYTRFRI